MTFHRNVLTKSKTAEATVPVVREPLDPRISLWHWLAFQLRYLREAEGLSLTQVGNVIGAARSTVSNIEAGRLKIDDRQAFQLDQRYRTGLVLQLLLYYARLGHNPEWFRQFSGYESQARVIKIYGSSVIPIPFQTERYARSVLVEGSTTDIEAAVVARMARQKALLEGETVPWIWLILDEAAIMVESGGRDTMREQLKALSELGGHPKISVRIVPMQAGWHPGVDGPFQLFTLETRDVAYAGAQRGGRLIEEPAEVREMAVDFDRIGQKALSAFESRARIERQMENLI